MSETTNLIDFIQSDEFKVFAKKVKKELRNFKSTVYANANKENIIKNIGIIHCSNCGKEINEVVISHDLIAYRHSDTTLLKKITDKWMEFETHADLWKGVDNPKNDIRCPYCGCYPFKNKRIRIEPYYKVDIWMIKFRNMEVKICLELKS